MALVPASRPAQAAASSSLVLYGSDSGGLVEQKLARLRSDREAHSRKQIWTKDAHGGPYQKVKMTKDYDPLYQLPDGTERKAEPGYERVKTGPTSNFVGSHMTQGAIDLVQAQLDAPVQPAELLLGAAAAAAAAERPRPRLLARGPPAAEAGGAAATALVLRPLQQYRWSEAGSAVRLEVPVSQLQLGEGAGAEVRWEVLADRLELTVTELAPAQAPSLPGSASTAPQPAAAHQLLLHPLHTAVVPARCRCYVTGLLALPPCPDTSSNSSSSSDGDGSGCTDGPAPPTPGASEQQAARAEQLHGTFRLPPGAEAVVVLLAKADPQQEWESLKAALPVVRRQAGSAGNQSTQSDLADLRRALRQQLGRAPAAATPAPASQGSAPPPPAPPLVPQEPPSPAAVQAALHRTEALLAAGQHVEALEAANACLARLPPAAVPQPEPAQQAVQLYILRARCHTQLGGLKQAAADYTTALQLLQPEGELAEHAERAKQAWQAGQQHGVQVPAQLCQLLQRRGEVYEQQERVEEALADVERALGLQQPPAPALMLAVQRLRQACKRRAGR